METILRYLQDLKLGRCSYPTYEEWKLDSRNIAGELMAGSYPTYEEWKLNLRNLSFIKTYCSYPTYEEWKLLHPSNPPKFCPKRSYPTYEEWKQS